MDDNLPCVAFYHANSRGTVGLDRSRISVSGWEFRSPTRQIGFKEHVVALSDHSDFNGLIEYVRQCRPKRVITDNYRISHGETLAKEITKRIGIPAIALPKRDKTTAKRVIDGQDLKRLKQTLLWYS